MRTSNSPSRLRLPLLTTAALLLSSSAFLVWAQAPEGKKDDRNGPSGAAKETDRPSTPRSDSNTPAPGRTDRSPTQPAATQPGAESRDIDRNRDDRTPGDPSSRTRRDDNQPGNRANTERRDNRPDNRVNRDDDRDQDNRDRSRPRRDPNDPVNRDRDRDDRNPQRPMDNRTGQAELNSRTFGVTLNEDNQNLTVGRLEQGSLAAQAGLREGDEIISVNGRNLTTEAQFNRQLIVQPGQAIQCVILRDGRRWTIWLPAQQVHRRQFGDRNTAQRANYDEFDNRDHAELGVTLDPRYQDGALVDRVAPDSPAEEAGLRRGDFIHGVNGRRVRSPQDLADIISAMEPGDMVEIEFTRRQERTLEARLGSSRDSSSQTRRYGDSRQVRFDEETVVRSQPAEQPRPASDDDDRDDNSNRRSDTRND